MDMQIADFKALCTPPAPQFVPTGRPNAGQQIPTHCGWGNWNCRRIMTDQFPEGEIFEIEGRKLLSKGVRHLEDHFLGIQLELFDLQKMQSVRFDVLAALALAKIARQL